MRWLLLAILLQTVAVEGPVVGDEIHWRVEARNLPFDGWRSRLVIDPAGKGWFSGSREESRSQDLLWRIDGEHIEPRALPDLFTRAYVIDLDSTGTLWVAPYVPTESATQDHLEVLHLPEVTTQPGAQLELTDWVVELVRPGLWPQAMAVTGPDAGWIGGNHAQLLERTSTGWQSAEIELEPGIEPLDLNVLDIALDDHGRGMLVGSLGLVARLEGGVWRQLAVPETLAGRKLFGVDLTPDGAAWMAGLGGVIARWHPADGWHVERPTAFTLMAIDMVNSHEGWAVGSAGTILRLRNGRWQRVPSPVSKSLFDIAMQDDQRGWIVGHQTVLRGVPEGSTLPLVESTPAVLASRPAHRLAAADLNGDGRLDLLLGEHDEVRVLLNHAGGWNIGAVLPHPNSPHSELLDGWAVGDGDGDGALDLLQLGEHGVDRHFYRNDGAGNFRDATVAAGFGAFPGHGNNAYWVDLDGDGDLDLYLSRGSLSGSLPLADQLYLNDGFGRFAVRQLKAGDVTIEKTVIWGDLDGDGDPDSVIPGYYPSEARVYRNDAGTLVDATATSGLKVTTPEINDGLLSDLDLDGDLDLVLAGEWLEFHRNDGFGQGGGFVQAGRVDSGFVDARAVFCRAGDLDLDGLPELLVHWRGIGGVSTKVLTLQASGGDGKALFSASVPETSDLLAGLGPLDDALLADLDGDGDLDPLLTGPHGTVLLEGQHNDHRWLRVRLHGHHGSVLGTQVRVHRASASGAPGALLAHVQVAPGAAGLSEVHTGLGEASTVDVEVLFPSPSHRRIVRRNVAAGSVLDVHDTAMPWRLLARASKATERQLRTPAARRQALALAAALAVVFVALKSLVKRRRSARHCGAYRLGPVLGEGSMGIVYRAHHVVHRHDVALKVLHPHLLRDETHRLRFLREARLMAENHHPALVRVEEAGEIDGRGFIAMELLEGRSLAHHLEASGALPPPVWRTVASALAEALSALHERGIVHRDLKSENVFVLDAPADDWAQRVRLMDLGLAWSAAQATLTRERVVVGTVATMAPERLQGAPADARADLWSLGVVLYEAATGRLPFVAADGTALVQAILSENPTPPNRQGAELSAVDETLILALLERDPAARPESAGKVAMTWATPALSNSGATPPSTACLGPSPPFLTADAGSSSTAPWLALYIAAREHFDAGQLSEADVAIVTCLQIVRTHIAQLDAERQVNYLARHDVGAVLELAQRLEHHLGKSNRVHLQEAT